MYSSRVLLWKRTGLKLCSHLPKAGWETHSLEIQRQPHQPHCCVSSGISATAQGIVLPTLSSLYTAPWADFWDTLSSICCCSGCTGLLPFQESGIKPIGDSAWRRIRHHLSEKNFPFPHHPPPMLVILLLKLPN